MSALSTSELARMQRFLSAHEHRFALALVRIPQVSVRDELSAQVENWCQAHHRPFLRFKLAGLTPDEVWDRIRQGAEAGTVAVLDDLDAALHEPAGEQASLLNRQRERIAELLPGPALLVLSDGAMNRLFVDAPDLADWHAANFEFEGAPAAIAPRAKDSAIPERSAEWIESRIALLQGQLNAASLRDQSRARILVELAALYRDSVYAVTHGTRTRSAFEGTQLAESALREAVAIHRRLAARGQDSTAERDLAVALDTLAQLLHSTGRYADAEPLYTESLQIRERVLGPDDCETLVATTNLGVLYRHQGRYAKAETLFLRGLSACERALGAEHPVTLTSVNNLAELYESQGRYTEAEPLFLRTLGAAEHILGAEHPDTLTVVNNLAGLYESQGRFAEAEHLYLQVLNASEHVLGPEHPNTLASLNNLAVLYQDLGRHREAEQLQLRAVTARERVHGSGHPATLTSLHNLAGLYEAQARYSEAEKLYRRVLAGRELSLGKDHPDTLITVNNLAGLCGHQARYEEAEDLYEHALNTAERVLGHDHPDTQRYRSNLERLRSEMLTSKLS